MMVYKTFNEVLTIKNGKNQKKVVDPNGQFPIYGSGGIMGYANDYLCHERTVIIGRKGSINNPIYVDTKFWNVDTAFGLSPKENLHSKYLYYFCLKYNFLKHNKATTLPSLTKEDLLKIQIPLPPLFEQQRIADLLDAADALRQKDKALLEKYEALGQSLFLELFGDPVKNEKGWEKVELSQLGSLDRGKSKHRPRNAPELLEGIHPLIQTGDLANCGLFVEKYNSTYSDFGLAQSKKWPKGTLCISIAANIAKTGILSFESCFPDSVVGFIPNEKCNVIFVSYLFSFLQEILEKAAPESAQKNINLEILRNLKVIQPSISLQNKFASQIELIEQQKAKVKENLAKSESLFQGLLGESFG